MTAMTAHVFPPHTHDQYGIGVIDQGGHASLSGARQVEAGPGDLILVNPGELHDGRPLDERGRSWRMLYFEPRWIDELQGDVSLVDDSEFAFVAPVIRDPNLRHLFDVAFACITGRENDLARMSFDAAALDLVARLVESRGRRRPSADGPRAAVAMARDSIDANPTQASSLFDLARSVGLSRFQLHRGFLKDFGLSPHLYILQRRIALARRLLKAGYPPADAALAAGFCDQSHLNRVFLRHFGVSPGRYRRG
jgi:AraC-like DNA-binding protein